MVSKTPTVPRGPAPFFAPKKSARSDAKKKRAVVIGAGCAGLTVAKNLAETRKFHVTVLEARENAGGRCRTHKFTDGGRKLVADLGPEFIGSQHDYVRKFLDEFGLKLTPVVQTDSEESGLVLTEREEQIHEQLREVASTLLPAWSGRKEQDAELLEKLKAYLDSITMREYLEKDFGVTSLEGRKRLALDLVNQMGVAMDGISALHVLLELAGWSESGEMGAPLDGRLVGGASALTDALAARVKELGAELRYGAVVSEIMQDVGDKKKSAGGALVMSQSGEEFFADTVVVAAPLPCPRDIKFTTSSSNPFPLPPMLSKAIHDVHYGDILKIALEFGKRWWCAEDGEMHPRGKPVGGLSGVVYECTNWEQAGYPRAVAEGGQDPAEGGILMAYLTVPLSDEIRALGSEEAQLERVLEMLQKEKLPEGLSRADMQFKRGKVMDWGAEKHTGAGVYAVYAPGQHAVREYLQGGPQVGCVHFAGEHTSWWQGYMNGAIESGHRVSWAIWNRFFGAESESSRRRSSARTCVSMDFGTCGRQNKCLSAKSN